MADSNGMLTLAMILDNPGEQPQRTRFRDPQRLRELGYSDLIVYPTTALSGLLGPETVEAGDIRQWVEQQYDAAARTVAEAQAAGLGVWLTVDAPSLARELVGHAMTCVKQPRVLCPASDELLEMSGQCLDALLARFDSVRGVVLRLGDNDASKLPYLIGNDVYTPHCARCSALGRAGRVARLVRYYYDRVVQQTGRKLIFRCWNARPGGMHDDEEVCRRIVEQLPVDEKLILSFKFTNTDFWRYQQWNRCSLACGDRPVIYELECQREFEGKGAVPNYQPPLWCGGMGELPRARGLSDVRERANVVGLWAWVRGGGWRGPYVTEEHEAWIEANVVAVPQLAADPQASPDALAGQWIAEHLKCPDGPGADAIARILAHSPQTILESFYIGPYALSRETQWYPAANFIQDDQVDAESAWVIVQRLGDADLDQVVAEKQAAEQRLADDRLALQQAADSLPEALRGPMLASLDYAESLVRTLHHLLAGMVDYRRYRRQRDPALAQ
ncbi:MAG: hypothetical protein OER86_09740, partial [Phycisphaerae bacterium]|nr:hypothetical protein [Phycisphaerae bacterium]